MIEIIFGVTNGFLFGINAHLTGKNSSQLHLPIQESMAPDVIYAKGEQTTPIFLNQYSF